MTEQLMTAVQVAELLAVPKTRVWSMSRRGEIPTMRIRPREVRYRREDIDVWIARRASRVITAARYALLNPRRGARRPANEEAMGLRTVRAASTARPRITQAVLRGACGGPVRRGRHLPGDE